MTGSAMRRSKGGSARLLPRADRLESVTFQGDAIPRQQWICRRWSVFWIRNAPRRLFGARIHGGDPRPASAGDQKNERNKEAEEQEERHQRAESAAALLVVRLLHFRCLG